MHNRVDGAVSLDRMSWLLLASFPSNMISTSIGARLVLKVQL